MTRPTHSGLCVFLERRMPDHDATGILGELASGRRERADQLAELVYGNLRRYAAAVLNDNGRDRTLQPTALVNEAFLRMVDQSRVDWQGRTHFFAVGAEMIRRVLVDDARARATAKRGGGRGRVELGVDDAPSDAAGVDVLALDESLRKLAGVDPRAARVVELRFFGGLKEQDVAAVLGVSASTVRDDWRMARAWLRDELSADRETGAGKGPGDGES
jgi:RNA polymerase sigma-70 factor, ECF subfamily